MNLHARISSLIANPVFSLFLCPTPFPSLPHLWWCTLTALSETWDVYRWTVRVAAQMCVCVCGVGGFYWNDHTVIEMRGLSQSTVDLFALCICISQSPTCMCIHVSLRGARIENHHQKLAKSFRTVTQQNCNMTRMLVRNLLDSHMLHPSE